MQIHLAWRVGERAELVGQDCFRFVEFGHFQHDARCLKLLHVAEIHGDNVGLVVGPLALGIQPRLNGAVGFDFPRLIDVLGRCPLREVLEVILPLPLGFILVLHHGKRLALACGKMLVPHFPRFVFDFREHHAELFGNAAANAVVVFGIDDALEGLKMLEAMTSSSKNKKWVKI